MYYFTQHIATKHNYLHYIISIIIFICLSCPDVSGLLETQPKPAAYNGKKSFSPSTSGVNSTATVFFAFVGVLILLLGIASVVYGVKRPRRNETPDAEGGVAPETTNGCKYPDTIRTNIINTNLHLLIMVISFFAEILQLADVILKSQKNLYSLIWILFNLTTVWKFKWNSIYTSFPNWSSICAKENYNPNKPLH